MEKILSEIRRILDVGYVNEEDDKELTNLLNTEVQKAVEEAVSGYHNWLKNLGFTVVERYDWVETYLQSLKGKNAHN